MKKGGVSTGVSYLFVFNADRGANKQNEAITSSFEGVAFGKTYVAGKKMSVGGNMRKNSAAKAIARKAKGCGFFLWWWWQHGCVCGRG